MIQKVLKKGVALDLESLASTGITFSERLEALLDALDIVEHGAGRTNWLAEVAEIKRLAAGIWLKDGNPKEKKLEKFAVSLCNSEGLIQSPREIVDYLRGNTQPLDVGLEMTKMGLNGPEQARIQIAVSRAMDNKSLDMMEPENVTYWAKTALRLGRVYLNKRNKGKRADEESLVITAEALLHAAIEGAI